MLEQGFVPAGIDKTPQSGNHRQFEPGQAFWLAMVLKLKGVGIKTPLAAKIADYAQQSLRGVAQNLGWDWQFQPFAGRFETEHRYFVDLGDLKHVRLVTDASPSGGGRLESGDWHEVGIRFRVAVDVTPCVIIRLDLSQIARLLAPESESAESA